LATKICGCGFTGCRRDALYDRFYECMAKGNAYFDAHGRYSVELEDLTSAAYAPYVAEDKACDERYSHNQRVRLRAFCADDDLPSMPSLVDVWTGVNWFEREAFDLYGILFEGHPDLRRILTDYGFVGHAFRKDFPLIGNVEVRYDPEKRRVVYEPVSIEPRVLVPRTIRDDSRYEQARAEREAGTK